MMGCLFLPLLICFSFVCFLFIFSKNNLNSIDCLLMLLLMSPTVREARKSVLLYYYISILPSQMLPPHSSFIRVTPTPCIVVFFLWMSWLSLCWTLPCSSPLVCWQQYSQNIVHLANMMCKALPTINIKTHSYFVNVDSYVNVDSDIPFCEDKINAPGPSFFFAICMHLAVLATCMLAHSKLIVSLMSHIVLVRPGRQIDDVMARRCFMWSYLGEKE